MKFFTRAFSLCAALLLVTCSGRHEDGDEPLGELTQGLGTVSSFTLIDAVSNLPIVEFDPIAAGATIDLSKLSTQQLNVRVNVSGTTGSVRIQLDSSTPRVENDAPFALFGDTNGDYAAGSLSAGAHVLTATPYEQAGATGTAGATFTRSFNVIAGTSGPPPIAGQLRIDPESNRGIVYNHDLNGDGRLDPYYLAGVGGPEGFLYEPASRKQQIVDRLIAHGGNGIYFHSIRWDTFGGGDGENFENPFVNHADVASGVDTAVLDNWASYLTQLDNAGVASFFFLYDDHVKPWGCTVPLPAAERTYIATLVQRFRQLKHLIWVTQEEFQFACTGASGIAKSRALAAEIRLHDPHHPIGVHHLRGQPMQFADDPNVDLFVQQTGADTVDAMHATGLTQGGGDDWSYVMGEAHHWHLDLLHAADRASLRRSSWATALSGGAVLMYNAFECQHQAKLCGFPAAGDPHDPSDDMLRDLRRLQQFMESARLGSLAPRDDLAYGGSRWVLANPTTGEYILYSNAGPTSLGVQGLAAGTYALRWFDPITGNSVTQTQTVVGGDTQFTKPTSVGVEAALRLLRTSAPPAITFTLINAATDTAIAAYDPIPAGATISIASLPSSQLTLRANAPSGTASVVFGLDGVSPYRTESAAPFSLSGDASGDYTPWSYTLKAYTVVGTAYAGSGGTGSVVSGPRSLSFTLVP